MRLFDWGLTIILGFLLLSLGVIAIIGMFAVSGLFAVLFIPLLGMALIYVECIRDARRDYRRTRCGLVALILLFAAPVLARDAKQVTAFRKTHPCPSTGKKTGACPGYVVDHIVPLCWGGEDSPDNMAWQDKAASYKKDVFEREACAIKKKYGSGG